MKVSLLASHLSTEPIHTRKQQLVFGVKLLVLGLLDTPHSKFACTSNKISSLHITQWKDRKIKINIIKKKIL